MALPSHHDLKIGEWTWFAKQDGVNPMANVYPNGG